MRLLSVFAIWRPLALCGLLALQPLLAIAQAAAPGWSWAQAITSPSDSWPRSLATDAAGNLYVGSSFRDPLTLATGTTLTPQGSADAYVAKYSPTGTLLWYRQVQGPGPEDEVQLSVDAAGNVYLVGNFETTTELGGQQLYAGYGMGWYSAMLNAQGQLQWLRLITDQPGSHLEGLGLDAAGNLYFSGTMSGRMVLPPFTATAPNGIDQFLAKLDPAGVVQWVRQGGRVPIAPNGPAVKSVFHSLTVGPTGDCYLSWTMNANAAGFGALPAGTAYGDYDVALIKYNSQGTPQWLQRYGSSLHEWAGATALDGQGHLLATMRFAGSFAAGPTTFGSQTLTGTGIHFAALAQLDAATGATIWVHTLSADRTASYVSVVADAAGNCYVGGSVTGTATFGTQTLTSTGAIETDALVASYSAQGTPRWARQSGSYFPEGVDFVSLDRAGRLAVAGYFRSAAQFGSTTLSGPTANNIASGFVAGLAPMALATQPIPAAPPMAPYPNPATDVLRLPALAPGTRVQLLDALGRVARSTTVSAAAEVSVQGLTPGFYTLRATGVLGQPYAARVVVE